MNELIREDKTKRELVEIVRIQIKEYQVAQKRIAELEEELNEAIEIIEHCGIDYDEILEVIKGGDL